MPNAIVTPHTAYFTERALHDTVEGTLVKCLRFARSARSPILRRSRTYPCT